MYVATVSSVKPRTIQKRLAWPSGRDDTHKLRNDSNIEETNLCAVYVYMSLVKVPPMTPEKTKEIIEQRLGKPIDEVFAWIDLSKPLGSASIAQVIWQSWWGLCSYISR